MCDGWLQYKRELAQHKARIHKGDTSEEESDDDEDDCEGINESEEDSDDDEDASEDWRNI